MKLGIWSKFTSDCNITTSLGLLSQLRKIFSPFSIPSTESSIYEILVYKADETTWVTGELVLHTAHQIDRGSSRSIPNVIILVVKVLSPVNLDLTMNLAKIPMTQITRNQQQTQLRNLLYSIFALRRF